MLGSLFRAFGDLFLPRVAAVLALCVALSIACFAGLWFGLHTVLEHWLGYAAGEEPWWLGWSTGAGTVALAWFTFPLVACAFVGLFLDRIAGVVERRHYAHLPPAKGLPLFAALGASLRFLALVVVVNVLLLAFLLFPIAYPVAWLVGNGLLLGREHFELVALRRHDAATARQLRQRHGGALLLAGAVLALLSLVPLLNFVMPVLGVVFFVHRLQAWTGAPAR